MRFLFTILVILSAMLVACAGSGKSEDLVASSLEPTIALTETSVPEPTATPEPTNTPELTATPTKTPKPTNTPTPTQTPSPKPSPTDTIEPTETPIAEPDLVVKADSINLRGGPGTNFDIIESADKGDYFQVLGGAYDCQWLQVESAGGTEGWVIGSVDYVSINVECNSLPDADIPSTPTAEASPTELVSTACSWVGGIIGRWLWEVEESQIEWLFVADNAGAIIDAQSASHVAFRWSCDNDLLIIAPPESDTTAFSVNLSGDVLTLTSLKTGLPIPMYRIE